MSKQDLERLSNLESFRKYLSKSYCLWDVVLGRRDASEVIIWPGDSDKQDCNWLCLFFFSFFPYGSSVGALDLPERVGEDFTGEALLS